MDSSSTEQRTRALRHYSAEASVALRIEQLEAQNAMLVEALEEQTRYVKTFLERDGASQETIDYYTERARAALANVEAARTGASHA